MNKTKTRTAKKPVTFASIMGEPKTKDEVLQQIRRNDRTYQKFLNMPFSYQEKILDFLCGKRGNPPHRERLLCRDGHYRRAFRRKHHGCRDAKERL